MSSIVTGDGFYRWHKEHAHLFSSYSIRELCWRAWIDGRGDLVNILNRMPFEEGFHRHQGRQLKTLIILFGDACSSWGECMHLDINNKSRMKAIGRVNVIYSQIETRLKEKKQKTNRKGGMKWIKKLLTGILNTINRRGSNHNIMKTSDHQRKSLQN